jgi:hypothetical protein
MSIENHPDGRICCASGAGGDGFGFVLNNGTVGENWGIGGAWDTHPARNFIAPDYSGSSNSKPRHYF